jgi:hypothetical protein
VSLLQGFVIVRLADGLCLVAYHQEMTFGWESLRATRFESRQQAEGAIVFLGIPRGSVAVACRKGPPSGEVPFFPGIVG